MRAWCLVLGSLLAATGCSTTLIRVPPPDAAAEPAGKPTIDEAIDLGSLPIREQGELKQDHSDDRFTPGEWVALVGTNLSTGSPKVTVGGVEVPVAGYLKGGSILIRVPRLAGPGKHTATVETSKGTAKVKLPTSIYAFGADTQSGQLRFRQMKSGDSFEEDELDVEFEKARFTALTADGSILYAIQKPNLDTAGAPSKLNKLLKVVKKVRGGPVKCNLMVVHMGGKDGPQAVKTIPFTISSKPTGMALGPQGLVVLQKRQLTVIDVSDPVEPRETSVLTFASKDQKRRLVDAVFISGGKYLAVLEAYENKVHLVDMRDAGNPTKLGGVRLSRAVGQPFSIDLELGSDGESVWVLQGPNLRLAGTRALGTLKRMWGDVRKLEFRQAAGRVGETDVSSPCRLVNVGLVEGEFKLTRSISLPNDLVPFFAQMSDDGDLFVSGISRAALDFSKLSFSLDGLIELLGMIKDKIQLGRVYKVSTRTGRKKLILRGTAIYYDMSILPSGKLMTSIVRLGPGYLPPRITLDWGFEIMGGQFAKLREIADSGFGITDAMKKLLPPYDYERIGSQ